MMKRILSSIVVLLLVTVLTVCAFAAAGGGYSSLALKQDSDVDYTALEEGDVFTVYIVLDPMLAISTNSVYRPYTSSTSAKDAAAALAPAQADLYGQTFTVSWNTDYFELTSTSAVTTQSGLSDGSKYFTTSNGKTLYLVSATKAQATAGNVIAPATTVESVAGPVKIEYKNGSSKFIGYIVSGKNDATNGILGCVAAIELKVKKAPSEKTELKISLNDTYLRPTATNSQTFDSTVSVTLAAGCQHKNRTNVSIVEEATCTKSGLLSFDCTDCQKTGLTETIALVPHVYNEEDRVTVEPTCTADGESYIICNTCNEHKGEIIPIPTDGHVWVYEAISKLTCGTDGKEIYYCQTCKHIAKVFTSKDSAPASDADIDTYTVYNAEDKKFYTDTTFTVVQNNPITSAVKNTTAPGHSWVSDGNGGYVCENTDICNGASPFVRYVGNSSKGHGDTPESYITLAAAMEYFSADNWQYGDDAECYIYLAEDIELTSARLVTSGLTAKAFEENPHNVHITIASADKENPATFKFGTNCTEYYLYGNTTFEYLNIAAATPGTADSGGVYICARGFKLVMGYGIEMLGTGIERSKTDSGIDGFSSTVSIPNAKVYVVAGVKNGGAQEGFDTSTLDTEIELYSGQYWSIYQYNRGSVSSKLTDARSKVTIGAITADTLLVNTDAIELINCHSVVFYVDDFNIRLDHSIGYDGKVSGSGNRLDRLYFPGVSENADIGDFSLNSAYNVFGDMTAYYYDGELGESTRSHFIIEGFEAKKTVADNNSYVNYNMSIASISEWCGTYGEEFLGIDGGHNLNSDGVCTFCGIRVCENHVYTALRVVNEADCSTVGTEQEYCTRCFTVVNENELPTADEHSYAWVLTGNTPVAKCSVCGVTAEDVETPTDFTNIYVSDNGTAFGGFSADAPLNDFDTAMKLAAKASGAATIHIVGKISVKSNVEIGESNTNYTFTEPTHSNKITICGYGNTKGIFEFGGGTGTGAKMYYNLSGHTVFSKLEFSTGTCPNKVYISARHNPIEFGENVSVDMQRFATGGPSSRIVVCGGCNGSSTCSYGSTPTDMIFRSGSYAIILGSGLSSGCNSPVNVKVLGDILVNEFMILGGYSPKGSGLNIGDINFELDGSVTVAEYFAFSSFSTSDAWVGDVTLVLRSGIIVTEAYKASPIEGRVIGTSSETDKTVKPTDRMTSLTVYYDPAENSTKTLADKIALSSDKNIYTAKILTGDNFCSVTNGSHVEGAVVEGTTPVEATCYAEGYKTVTCTKCSKVYTAAIPTLSHVTALKTTLAATCVSPALEMYACTNEGCNAVEYKIVSGSTALDPNAFESHNVENGVCTVCKKSVVQICADRSVKNDVDLTGHNYTSSTVTKSCGSGTAYECEDCGYTYVDIDSESHNYGAYSVTVEPTETAPGVKSRTCKSCGKVDTALLYAADSVYTEAVATDASGNVADIDIATSKLSKYEREALNALLQETAYGSEVKVSYKVEGDTVTDVTYSIPVPAEYSKMTNVKVVIKDDNGVLHTVDFVIEKGYIVFTF